MVRSSLLDYGRTIIATGAKATCHPTRVEVAVARYGKEHKEATRRRIVEAAGRRLKRDGIDGSGVAALMADAGLTNGAFYAHFASQEDLGATAVADQLHEHLECYRAAAPMRAGVERVV